MSISNPTLAELLEDAWIHRRNAEYDMVKKLLEQVKSEIGTNDHLNLGRYYHILAQVESDHEQFDRAHQELEKSVDAYRKSENQRNIAHSVRHLADVQYELNKLEEAEMGYLEALNIYEQIDPNSMHHANALRGYAVLLEKLHRMNQAKATWSQARTIYLSYEISEGVAECDAHLK